MSLTKIGPGPVAGSKSKDAMKPFSLFAGIFFLVLAGCSTHHWAEVEASTLPPPDGPLVRHTSRVIIDVNQSTQETQCVVYERHHPVCFYNVRPALEAGLARSLWPSFPEVLVGKASDAGPMDYVLQIDLELDALPPDEMGPGWSAGVRGRFRLMRGDEVLSEETTASRSRAHFAYGAPLGQGATEAFDATIHHIAGRVFSVPESRPDEPVPLPQVASRSFAHSPSPSDTGQRPSKTEGRLDESGSSSLAKRK